MNIFALHRLSSCVQKILLLLPLLLLQVIWSHFISMVLDVGVEHCLLQEIHSGSCLCGDKEVVANDSLSGETLDCLSVPLLDFLVDHSVLL